MDHIGEKAIQETLYRKGRRNTNNMHLIFSLYNIILLYVKID